MHKVRRRRGAVIATVLFSVAVLLGMAALCIDYGVAALAKQQLQNAVDAAALAAVSTLQMSLDPVAAVDAAVATAQANRVWDGNLTLDPDTDIVVGAWDDDNHVIYPFEVSGGVISVPDGTVAVQVVGRRTEDAADGPIHLYFAKVLGIETVNLTARATATLTVSRNPRPPVEVMLAQDQSGSFEDEFPYARTGNVEFIDFMRDCFADGDRVGICGFGQHAIHEFMDNRSRMDTNLFHDVHPTDEYETAKYEIGPDEYSDPLSDYVAAMPTIPYSGSPQGNSWTNMYTGLLRAGVGFAEASDAQARWQEFIDHFYADKWWETASSTTCYSKGTYNQWEPYRSVNASKYTQVKWFDGKKYGRRNTTLWVRKDIGWYWKKGTTTQKNQLKAWIDELLDYDFANGDAEHVVVLVSDGMPWWGGGSAGDSSIKALGTYIADKLAEKGIRIHTVTLDQGTASGDMGADSEYNASLCRNGGYAFYTYDAARLKTLMVGVGQVEVGQSHLMY